MKRISLVGVAFLSLATAASAEFPTTYPTGKYTSAGYSMDKTQKVFIDPDPHRYDDEVSGAATILFSTEQTHSSGRHYWARRTGFGGHCAANTIYFSNVSGYQDQNGVDQFADDAPNPMVIIPEETATPKSLGDIVLSAACKR